MKTALMVAEKPSLALAIANILSNGNVKTRKGLSNACSVHEYVGTFNNEPVKFKMTSVCGHVMTLDFHKKYNNWDKVDPSELFEATVEKVEANSNLKIPLFLSKEAQDCEYLILWLDCDKEGENICFEVINSVRQFLLHPPYLGKNVFRAKFSAITEKEMKSAMKNLILPNENEARSVDARQELDLRIGCAFTRFQTKFFQGKYGNLDSSLISFGPCQTPTLGFCVQRYDAVQNFKPEPYWSLRVEVQTPKGSSLKLDWERGRLFDKEVATFFLNTVKEHSFATVTSVKTSNHSKQRPQALNTVELMRVASSGLGMGPHQAMQIAERLYTQGYISYPRTETTSYPESFDLKEVLRLLSRNRNWEEHITEILSSKSLKPRKGTDKGDHPPITPTKLASSSELENDAWRIYDYIARHFIASLSADMTYLQTTVHLQIGEEQFSCVGKQLIDPGYTKIFSWQALGTDEKLPSIDQGDNCPIKEMTLPEKMTQPPSYLTESELITLMEKHGIGTDASIPVHIHNICLRNYVSIETGRSLVPTTLGVVLVHGYHKIDPELVLPTMRASVEKQLTLIANGEAKFDDVLIHTLKIFYLKFVYFVTSITDMDEFFSGSFKSLCDSGKPFTKCGKCHRFLKIIVTNPARLYCNTCKETLPLPRISGNFREFNQNECPLDGYQLIQCTNGSAEKSFIVCPYCFNNPPFEDMREGISACNSCTNPTCPYSLVTNGVLSCGDCTTGVLVFDPMSGPAWKLSCNRCTSVVFICRDAAKVKVDKSICHQCEAQLFSIEFKKEKTPLADGKIKITGCMFCEPELSKTVNFINASNKPRKNQYNRHSRNNFSARKKH